MKVPITVYSTRNRKRTYSQPVIHWVIAALAVSLSIWLSAWVVTAIVTNIQQAIK